MGEDEEFKEGIREVYKGLKFKCEVIKIGEAIYIKLKPFIRKKLLPAEIQKIKDEIKAKIEG